MRINGVVYTSLTAMQGVVREDVVAFLTEWYDSQAYVNGHTSGSTGVPKPVALLKSDMQASARLTNSYLGIDAQYIAFVSVLIVYSRKDDDCASYRSWC